MFPPAPANRYFVLRHGFSQANDMGLIVSDLQRGKQAFGLTERGREQVTNTVTMARDQGTLDKNVVIVSSPFRRAVETAQIAVEVLGCEGGITQDQRLRERFFGSFELGKDTQYDQVWDQDRIDPSHTQWGVEAVTAEVIRVEALIRDLNRRCQNRTVLLVTHGDIASLLLCWARGEDLRRHREVGALETAGLCEVQWQSKNE